MFKAVAATILFLALLLAPASSASSTRITNGSTPDMYYWPHAASLFYTANGGVFCSGTVVHRQWVLTAAHCLRRGDRNLNPKQVAVTIGAKNLAQAKMLRLSSRVVIHPGYSYSDKTCILFVCWGVSFAGNIKNDLALLKMDEPVPANLVAFIPGGGDERFFQSYTNSPNSETKAWMGGYGETCTNCKSSNLFRQGLGKLLTADECGSYVPNNPAERHILCMENKYPQHSKICQGDSGGPLLWRDWKSGFANSHHIRKGLLIGVASFTSASCSASERDNFSAFFHIRPFYSWIRSTTR